MVLMFFLKKLVGGKGGGGMFAYLSRINENKTRIELERTRQATAKDLISNLRDGVVLRESGPDGWTLEIWMPPPQAPPMFFLGTESRQSGQHSPRATEVITQHAKELNQQDIGVTGDPPRE
jgi:hypothetical protein